MTAAEDAALARQVTQPTPVAWRVTSSRSNPAFHLTESEAVHHARDRHPWDEPGAVTPLYEIGDASRVLADQERLQALATEWERLADPETLPNSTKAGERWREAHRRHAAALRRILHAESEETEPCPSGDTREIVGGVGATAASLGRTAGAGAASSPDTPGPASPAATDLDTDQERLQRVEAAIEEALHPTRPLPSNDAWYDGNYHGARDLALALRRILHADTPGDTDG